MTSGKRPAFEERRLDVRATSLRYFVGGAATGAAPPVVLVHGFAGAASNWSVLAPLLAASFRLIVPDLPGHGGSTPLPAAPNLAGFADRVASIVEREDAAGAVVVGHSMGGIVALRLAARRPELVRGLVLAAAAGISTTTRAAEIFLTGTSLIGPGRRVAVFRRRIARSPRLRSLVFDAISASDAGALSEAAALGFLSGSRQYSDILTAARALAREDVHRDLEQVRSPAFVLWGARDRQVPVDDAFEYARRLRAPVRVIPDCGHLLIGERPEACADAIEAFATALVEAARPAAAAARRYP
jgi:pimeloyl-ACP methyl ester carboxylesterase